MIADRIFLVTLAQPLKTTSSPAERPTAGIVAKSYCVYAQDEAQAAGVAIDQHGRLEGYEHCVAVASLSQLESLVQDMRDIASNVALAGAA